MIFGAVIDPNMDGEMVITVVATGFGHTEPRLRLVDKQAREAVQGEELRSPQWRRNEENGSRWSRNDRGSSLEVPAFLRKGMD